jgi:hypothetical protein
MPTYERTESFIKAYKSLSRADREKFGEAVKKFVRDLESGGKFRKGLRVKGIRGAPGLFEMTWADDGRAVFQYGASIKGDEPHVIWHAVGTHDVLP